MATIDQVEIPTLLFEEQSSAPATPAAGFQRIYPRSSDGHFVRKDSGGTVTDLESGGGSLTHAYVGYNTIGGSLENVTNYRVYLKKISPAVDGLLSSIGVYIGQATDAVYSHHVGVFSDNAGAPDRLLGMAFASRPDSDAGHGYVLETAATPTYTPGWVHVPMGLWLTAGDYWLAFQPYKPTGTLNLYYDGSGSDRYADAGGHWLAHYGRLASPTTSSNKYSIRADFVS